MKSLTTIATAALVLAPTLTFAQPTINATYATKDVASVGLVYSEHPVVKTKASLDNKLGYISYQRVATVDQPTKFFYDYAAIGTSKETKHANIALEASSVNVGGFGRVNELWAKVTAKAPLSPAIEYGCDFGAESGQYAALSVSKSATLGGIDTNVEAAVGYNHNLSRDMNGLSHARVDITASKQLTPKLSVSASARLQKAIHKSFTDEQMYSASASYKF